MPHDIDKIQSILEPLLPGLLGVKLVSVEDERIVAHLHVRPQICTTGGILHGGAYMAFADTLGAIGSFLCLPPGARTTTTTDSSTKFIAGAKEGSTVIGECVALHRGRTTQVWQTTMRRDDGKLCAVVTQTQLTVPGTS
jgi:uncharacterized protein (TIGR00369 family)